MLRKKISKLIVGIMTGVMLLTGASNYGQVVFANTGAVVEQVEKTETIDTQGRDSSQKFLNAIKNLDVSQIKLTNSSEVKKEFNLTEEIVKALNDRKKELKIVIEKGTILTIENIKSDLILDGKNKLEIIRGEQHSGNLLQVKDGVDKNITIQNIIFENLDRGAVFRNLNKNNNVKVTLMGNDLKNYMGDAVDIEDIENIQQEEEEIEEENLFEDEGDSALAEDKNNTIFIKNILNGNLLYKDQQIDIKADRDSTKTIPGYTSVEFVGKIWSRIEGEIKNVIGEGRIDVYTAEELAEMSDQDKLGGDLSSNVTIEEDSTFKFKYDNLTSGVEYGAVVLFGTTAEDSNGNKYKLTLTPNDNYFTTLGIKTSNKTHNSITLTVPHDKNINYPLELLVKGENFEKKFTGIDGEFITNLNELSPNTKYIYELKDSKGSVVTKGEFTTEKGEINASDFMDVTINDMENATITDIFASIPVSNAGVFNNLKNGKYHRTNLEGISVKIGNEKIELMGLVPEKEYRNLTLSYTDENYKFRRINLPAFKTKTSTEKLKQFIIDVYRNSLERLPDEKGFVFWEDELKNKRTSPEKFVKNLLNEIEFNSMNTTIKEKIEKLYRVIVNRGSDSEGLSYWTKKYEDLKREGVKDLEILSRISDEMVNEKEFRERVEGIKI